MTTQRRIFVSHAFADRSLVTELLTLLESGAGIPFTEFFCTSLDGIGVRAGEHFNLRIGRELAHSKAAIALISPRFYDSSYCMCELGALWGRRKRFVPVVVSPVEKSQLDAVLTGIQAVSLDKGSDLDLLRDYLLTSLDIGGHPVARWNELKAAFLTRLPMLYRPWAVSRVYGEIFLQRYLEGLTHGLSRWMQREKLSTRIWLVILDIDRLNQINAKYGVGVGNLLLDKVLEIVTRSEDAVIQGGRCGDDTFFSVFIGTDTQAVEHATNLVRQIAEVPKLLGNRTLWVSASAGVAAQKDAPNLDWINRAYQGCLEAREAGGNQVREGPLFTELNGWSFS